MSAPRRPSTPPPRSTHSDRRTRPRLTEQIQVIRELWLLREQARVQAAERCFLAELERLLSGRPYSSDPNIALPPPPPHTRSRGPVTATSPIPHAPPMPPFPPSSPSAFSAVSFLSDGAVFESNPPPRGDRAPVRERPGTVSQGMEQARASQRVTNLNADFRARLEGQNPEFDLTTLSRSRSFGQLTGQRAVSSVLDSQFRHRLENVLHRRQSHGLRRRRTRNHFTNGRLGGGDDVDMRVNATRDGVLPAGDDIHHDADHPMGVDGPERSAIEVHDVAGFGRMADGEALEVIVTALREEVTVLRNVVNASFDLQLDIQRSIRQEVAAAMNAPARLSLTHDVNVEETSACTVDASSTAGTSGAPTSSTATTPPARADVAQARVGAMKAGLCTVCLEEAVDSLLYGCGHMCTCASCGRQLLAGGQNCPICRAPVRDVVKAFVVTG